MIEELEPSALYLVVIIVCFCLACICTWHGAWCNQRGVEDGRTTLEFDLAVNGNWDEGL